MAPYEQWLEHSEWRNPLREAKGQKPHLGEAFFGADSSSPNSDAKNSGEALLRVLYCPDREHAARDISMLHAFLRSVDKQLLIIEGDVGVGKTWFLRYNLLVRPPDDIKACFGVIDVLHAHPGRARESLYRDLIPILERYFRETRGSARNAMYGYGLMRYASGVGEDSENPSPEVKAGATALVESWRQGTRESYVEALLDALEVLEGPIIFIGLDNLDRAAIADQGELLDLSIRVLRNHKIRLLVPLRRTSHHLKDRYTGLYEVRHQPMVLSSLNTTIMTRRRFEVSSTGESFLRSPRLRDGHREFTYPDIHDLVFSGETGNLIRGIVGNNARVALQCIERLVTSDLLRGLHNIANLQFVIAAMMLGADYRPDGGAPIINLFDNDETGRPGNGLVRFRVLERLQRDGYVHLGHRDCIDHFDALGYDLERIVRVVARFLMADMVELDRCMTPSDLLLLSSDEMHALGVITISSVGRMYVDILLKQMWYFVAAKRGLVGVVPQKHRSFDPERKYYYMTHNNMIDFLKDEESAEHHHKRRWEATHGKSLDTSEGLSAPHHLAEQALLRRPDNDDQ